MLPLKGTEKTVARDHENFIKLSPRTMKTPRHLLFSSNISKLLCIVTYIYQYACWKIFKNSPFSSVNKKSQQWNMRNLQQWVASPCPNLRPTKCKTMPQHTKPRNHTTVETQWQFQTYTAALCGVCAQDNIVFAACLACCNELSALLKAVWHTVDTWPATWTNPDALLGQQSATFTKA